MVSLAVLVAADAVWAFGDRLPILSSLLTDALLLLFVAAAVDSVLRHREDQRVREVGRVMYRVLAQVVLDGDRRLRALVAGSDLAGSGVPAWDVAYTAEVRAVHASVWRDRPAPAPAPTASASASAERLGDLLRSHAFVRMLYLDVSVYKRRLHDVVGQWAPVMLASGASATDLRRVGSLADRLGELHQAIYHGASTTLDADHWRAPDEWVHETCEAFVRFLEEADDVRRFYHVLAEEDRRLGPDHLDAHVAVTRQPPLYEAEARQEVVAGCTWWRRSSGARGRLRSAARTPWSRHRTSPP